MQDTQSQERAGSRQRGKAEVEALVEAYRNSGLSLRAFAQRAGIAFSSLQRWVEKARQRQAQESRRLIPQVAAPGAPGFSLLEVELEDAGVSGRAAAAHYELGWADGTRLRIGSGFEDGEVRRLLNLLKEVR
jgi:hypothetical protein